MTIQLSHLRPIIPFVAALILPACATSHSKIPAQDVLLKDIAANEVSLYANETSRSVEDDVCQTFYSNTGTFIAQPKTTSSEEIMGTIFLAALAGGATYGVGALGITNAFAALSLAASTNQVVYEGGKAAMEANNSVESDLSPEVEIADAALRLGCPQPSRAAMKLAVVQAQEDKKTEKKLAKIRRKEKKLAGKTPVCRDGDTQNC